jgi:peptidoglycan hydrolase-like protein with peptidoglycan-binding domain
MQKTIMKKCAALLLTILLSVPAYISRADIYPYTSFTISNLRMRSAPSSGAAVLLTIPAGDAVLITGATEDYYIIAYEGQNGYALQSFFSAVNPNATPAATDSAPDSEGYLLLKSGSQGPSVKALQQGLMELGFYSGAIDSKYGAGTMLAVKLLQAENGLAQTGIADIALQKLLFEGMPKDYGGTKTNIHTLPPIPGYSINEGDQGDAVITLQQNLARLGYYAGTIDGVCGKGTVAAVKAFQVTNNLKSDGVAGKATQAILYGQGALAAGSTPTPKPVLTATPTASVAPKSNYPYSTTVSAAVNLRASASVSGTRILTIPNGATVSVLSAEESFVKITYNSYTGYVLSIYVNIPMQYLAGITPAPNLDARLNYETLSQGDNGVKVRALQQALKELGFYAKEIDGDFGSGTIASVKSFQSKNGYLQTGFALPEMQLLLYEGKPKNMSGNPVEIKTLPPISGYTMRLNDTGDAVVWLQDSLKALHYYTGASSGTYTQATASAVKAFQAANNLTADGVAGAKTQTAISKTLTTPTPVVLRPTPTVSPLTEENVIVIQLDTRGLAVIRLQTRLVELGFYSITPDGICSSDDVVAIRAFQSKNGLKADGIAGLATQLALFSAQALSAFATAVPSPSPVPSPNTQLILQIGASGAAVTALQKRLSILKYFSGSADGIFGINTAKAVSSFQERNSLSADGVAGTKTLAKLYSSSAIKAFSATATPTAAPKILKIGDTGTSVKNMQKQLITLGYLSGSADGIFGPSTYLALKAFQLRNNLASDGIAGTITLALLDKQNAVPAAGSTPPVSGSFTAPSASEVRFANWYTEIRSRARTMPDVIIYDYVTGLHYKLHIFSLGKHADAEPPTAQDTAVMNQIIGENNWTAHAVWVIFSDGRVYMASTHSHGHEVDHTSGNALTGHVCIHFPREPEEAAATGPYAVSHQKAILLGWAATQALIR